MRNFWVKLLCCFIPFKEKRRKIRKKLLNSSIDAKLDLYIQKLDFLEKLIKVSVNVSEIPAATGNLSLIQKASVAILVRFLKAIKNYNLRWWLDAGTLIGFVRHNGFIPWDDDIDIAIMREDYEKLPEILEKNFAGEGFFFQIGEIIRLYYKDLHIWVDIFPMDIGYSEKCLQGDEYKKFVQILNQIKSSTDFNHDKWLKHKSPVSQKYLSESHNIRDKYLVPTPHPNGFIFYGVEVGTNDRNLFEQNLIFPLKPVSWMGVDVFIPNDFDKYLRLLYGDYMSWPNSFSSDHGEGLNRKIDVTQIDEYQKLIQQHFGTSNS